MLILKYKPQFIQMRVKGLKSDNANPLGMVVKMKYQKKLSHKDLVCNSCYRLIFQSFACAILSNSICLGTSLSFPTQPHEGFWELMLFGRIFSLNIFLCNKAHNIREGQAKKTNTVRKERRVREPLFHLRGFVDLSRPSGTTFYFATVKKT